MEQVQTSFPGASLLGSVAPLTGDLSALGAGPGAGNSLNAPLASDGVAPQWWSNPIESLTGGEAGNASGGGFFGVIASAIASLGNIINSIGTSLQNAFGESQAEGAPSQSVQNATFSSTGDPHLAETGTAIDANGNTYNVNSHFESMSGHENLVSSQDFDGGYRVSTNVTAPNAHGVTQNQSATVHTNNNGDTVTMNHDGSYAISNDGTSVQLGLGQSTTLDGGETVARGADGSLTVTEANANGGSISTTMKSNGGGGVDVTGSVQNATLGGDLANTAAMAPNPPPPLRPFPGHVVREATTVWT